MKTLQKILMSKQAEVTALKHTLDTVFDTVYKQVVADGRYNGVGDWEENCTVAERDLLETATDAYLESAGKLYRIQQEIEKDNNYLQDIIGKQSGKKDNIIKAIKKTCWLNDIIEIADDEITLNTPNNNDRTIKLIFDNEDNIMGIM